MPPTNQVLLVFREGTSTTVEDSSALAAAVSGGVLQSSVLRMLGTAPWVTIMVAHTGTTSIRSTVSRCVSSGISPFDPLALLLLNTLSRRAARFLNITPQGSIFEIWSYTVIYLFISKPTRRIGFERKCYSKTWLAVVGTKRIWVAVLQSLFWKGKWYSCKIWETTWPREG